MKHFADRSYNQFLTLILHLQEVVVSQDDTGNKYRLVEQVRAIYIDQTQLMIRVLIPSIGPMMMNM